MTSLFIDNIAIPIPQNFNLRLNFENPLFLEGAFNKIYAYSFALSACPELNSLFEHAERMNSSNSKQKYAARILFSGVMLVNGHAIIERGSENNYMIYIQQEGFDLVERLQNLNLRDLNSPEYEIWGEDESLTISEKRNRWLSHIQDNQDGMETSGEFKFPRISGKYEEDNENLAEKENPVFTTGINQYVMGQMYVNPTAVNGTKPFDVDKQWLTTVAPVPRLEEVLLQILNDFSITINRNDLQALEDFKRLLGFAGVVLDEYANDGIVNNNVHGRTYSMKDLLPENKCIHLFHVLRDVFSCFFVVNNSALNILLSNKVLNSVEINMTKFATPAYDPKFLGKFNFIFRLPEFSRHGATRAFIDAEEDDPILDTFVELETNSEAFEQKEITASFDLFFNTPALGTGSLIILTYEQFVLADDLKPEFYHNINVPNFWRGAETIEFIRSNEINNAKSPASKNFHIMWYWGIRTTKFFQTSTSTYFDVDAMIAGIFSQFHYFNSLGFDPLTLGDGNLSFNNVELNGDTQEGIYARYHKQKTDLINGAKEVDKTLYLPPHKIVEIAKWENPRHYIENPKGTFIGVVKKMSLTITANSISPTTVTYVSQTK